MDGLPMREDTGLPSASTVTARNEHGATVSVALSCGHDDATIKLNVRTYTEDHPTLETGLQAMLAAAGAWLGAGVERA